MTNSKPFQNGQKKGQLFVNEKMGIVDLQVNNSGFIVSRIGGYQIIEGSGVDGGFWFAKGHGENKKFKTLEAAEEHANISMS